MSRRFFIQGMVVPFMVLVMLSGCAQPAAPTQGATGPGEGVQPSASEAATETATPAVGTDAPDIEPGTAVVWEETDQIRVNQAGYTPGAVKRVVVAGIGSASGKAFHLVPMEGGPTAYADGLEEPVKDTVTDQDIAVADFSAFSVPGTYRLAVEGIGASYPFRIGEDVYDALDDAVLKFFYYQRCGTELPEAFAGDWKHGACHLGEGTVLEDDSVRFTASGGWHDAGDYGRYAVNTAVALADLLLAHDLYPTSFADDTGIPESGNGIPDILDEARYALEWLLRMQDPESGGVYHKLTSVNFPAMLLLPEHDLMQMYYSPMSTTATADAAAVLALAARAYETLDPAFAQTCLAAAEKAWHWLQEYEGTPGFKNPAGMLTGEYGDNDDRDERFWAAAELFRTTGAAGYGDAVRVAFAQGGLSFTGLGWQEVSGFGSMAYVLSTQAGKDAVVVDGLTGRVLEKAGEKQTQAQADTYGSSLLASEYGWGSNSGLLNNAMLMLLANRLQPEDAWLAGVDASRQYLLGRNVLGQSYFTGFGTKTVKQPHHRPSAADRVRAPVPGMLAGGPNGQLQDPAVKAACEGQPPAACYVDDISSYSTNEIAINWNAPAVFVFAGLREAK